jgi:hypothetical protein
MGVISVIAANKVSTFAVVKSPCVYNIEDVDV